MQVSTLSVLKNPQKKYLKYWRILKEDENVSERVEQKLKSWESKGGEGKGTKPETMNQNVGDRNLNRVTEGKGIVTVKNIRFDKGM